MGSLSATSGWKVYVQFTFLRLSKENPSCISLALPLYLSSPPLLFLSSLFFLFVIFLALSFSSPTFFPLSPSWFRFSSPLNLILYLIFFSLLLVFRLACCCAQYNVLSRHDASDRDMTVKWVHPPPSHEHSSQTVRVLLRCLSVNRDVQGNARQYVD